MSLNELKGWLLRIDYFLKFLIFKCLFRKNVSKNRINTASSIRLAHVVM